MKTRCNNAFSTNKAQLYSPTETPDSRESDVHLVPTPSLQKTLVQGAYCTGTIRVAVLMLRSTRFPCKMPPFFLQYLSRLFKPCFCRPLLPFLRGADDSSSKFRGTLGKKDFVNTIGPTSCITVPSPRTSTISCYCRTCSCTPPLCTILVCMYSIDHGFCREALKQRHPVPFISQRKQKIRAVRIPLY